MFSIIFNIAVDDQGSVFIADAKLRTVKAYDQNGNYLFSMGRGGQGPGEFTLPQNICITENKIIIYDYKRRKLISFSPEGKYLEEKVIFAGPSDCFLDSKENLFGINFLTPEEKGKHYYSQLQIMKCSPPYRKVEVLAEMTMKSNSNWDYYVIGELPGDKLLWARDSEYSMNIYDITREKTICQIRKKEDHRTFDSNGKEDSNQGSKGDAKFNDEKKAFIDICTSDRGEIFVRTYRKAGDDKIIYDIFNAEGKYITQIALDSIPYVIKNNKLYGIFFDKDGCCLVKRYQLSWQY